MVLSTHKRLIKLQIRFKTRATQTAHQINSIIWSSIDIPTPYYVRAICFGAANETTKLSPKINSLVQKNKNIKRKKKKKRTRERYIAKKMREGDQNKKKSQKRRNEIIKIRLLVFSRRQGRFDHTCYLLILWWHHTHSQAVFESETGSVDVLLSLSTSWKRNL